MLGGFRVTFGREYAREKVRLPGKCAHDINSLIANLGGAVLALLQEWNHE